MGLSEHRNIGFQYVPIQFQDIPTLGPLGFALTAQAQRLRQHGLSAVVCSPQGGEASWPQVLHAVQNGAFVVFMSPERALKEAREKCEKNIKEH